MEDTQTQAVQPASEPMVTEDSSQPVSPASESAEAPVAPVEPTSAEQPAVAPVAPAEVQPESQPTRLERRLDQLHSKGQGLQELTDKLTQLRETPSPSPVNEATPTIPKLSELVQEGQTLMPEDLDTLGQKVYEQGAQSARGMSALEIQQLRNEITARDALRDATSDTEKLPVLYSELDSNSPNYNPALDKKIADQYQRLAIQQGPNGQILVNPAVRLADVAKQEMDFFREAMEAGKMQTSATLAQQASEGALIPTNSSAEPEKSFEDLPLDQMEARLRAQGRDI